jgi:hypothetical protein
MYQMATEQNHAIVDD